MSEMRFEQVAPGVSRLPARPRSLARSHAYALLGSRVLLVEPAHVGEAEQDFWVAWVKEHGAAIVLTHEHIDHTHGVAEIQEATGCEVWAPPRGRPTAYAQHQQYAITRELREGVELGDWTVLDVPGHAERHVALRRGGVLISGDALSDGDGSVEEYLSSMQRLISLDPELVLPAHGPSISMRACGPWLQVRAILSKWRGEAGHG